MKATKIFKVVAKSQNTNSFGLYQMVVVAKDGEAYKTHASMYNAKNIGEEVHQDITFHNSKAIGRCFIGHEMMEKIPQVPSDVLREIWK